MTFSPVILDGWDASWKTSAWDARLVLKQDDQGQFYLAICMHEVLGNIDELPQETRYNQNGEVVVPAEFKGGPVIGLGDGQWLLGPRLEEAYASAKFERSSLSIADAFLAEHGWPDASDSGSIREAIEAAIKSANRT